jgi:DNA-binding protein H-NS
MRVSLKLSHEEVAAAEACGIAFPPASPAQVQRLSMQRKVFEIDGRPHLATRDGSLFETAGTLEHLIAAEVEARQQADLAAWEAGGMAEPSPAPAPAQAAPEPAGQGERLEDAKAALRAEVERRAAELGIAPGDLFSWLRQQTPVDKAARTRKPRGDAGAGRAARYRGPGGEEWSGRGRPPRWLTAQEAGGRDRTEFAVGPGST